MAENWRTPYPYQQNPGSQQGSKCQQEWPSMQYQPPPPYPGQQPPPPYPDSTRPMASRPSAAYTPSGGAPMDARGHPTLMMLSMLYAQPVPSIQPPTQPLDPLHRYILQEIPDPVEAPSQGGAMVEQKSATGEVPSCQETPNPLTGNTNLGSRVQAGPSRERNLGEVNSGLQYSQYLVQAALEVQTTTTAQASPQQRNPKDSAHNKWLPLRSPDTSSSSEDGVGPLSSYSPTSPPPRTPLPGAGLGPQSEVLSHEARALLEHEFKVCPEAVESCLRCLPDGVPTTQWHLEMVADLRTQLHPVPPDPYCRLLRSLPLELRKRLRRIRYGTYTIRKAENKWLQREHMQRTEREVLSLRNQVLELMRARDDLQQQLVNYQDLQQEIEMLRDQVASYQCLRMTGTSAYVSDGQ
ncbi:hypothetical protein ABVT39_020127 [Epinephelus coioides]